MSDLTIFNHPAIMIIFFVAIIFYATGFFVKTNKETFILLGVIFSAVFVIFALLFGVSIQETLIAVLVFFGLTLILFKGEDGAK